MRLKLLAILAVGLLIGADGAKDKADTKDKPKADDPARKERVKLQGTWTLESLEEDGKAVPQKTLRKRTLFCGGDKFILRDGREVAQIGSLQLIPGKNPKAVNVSILGGTSKGKTMLGIYQLDGNTLKLCYDPQGAERPTDFKTAPKSGRSLAVYKRPNPPAGEETDITGIYEVESRDMASVLQPLTVKVEKVGDAYTLAWGRGGEVAHIGIGLRKGNLLSVSFAGRDMAAVAVYQIEKGPRLIGDTTRLGGIGVVEKEVLTFVKKGD